MNSVVYIKTAKGREEIATRKHQLGSKLRAMLLVVDGVRPASALAAGSRDVEAQLERLLGEGFIEAVTETGAPPKAVHRKASPAAPEPVAPPAPVDPLVAARSTAVRLLEKAMGRDANHFAARLEACMTGEDLLAQAERFAIVLGTMRDKRLGDDYLRQVRAALRG